MALCNRESVLATAWEALQRLEPDQGLELLCYKRNRGVTVIRTGSGRYLVRERGYQEQELEVEADELPKLLKTIAKREFPRSRKVRLYRLESPAEGNLPRKKL